jgi:hypothetical protein
MREISKGDDRQGGLRNVLSQAAIKSRPKAAGLARGRYPLGMTVPMQAGGKHDDKQITSAFGTTAGITAHAARRKDPLRPLPP